MFKKLSLATQIGIGLIGGFIFGAIMSAIGVGALVQGIANITDVKKLGRIAVRTLIFFFFTTACAVGVGLLVANIFDPGSGLNLSMEGLKAKQVEAPSMVNVFLNIVPLNPFEAFAKGNILQVIFFAIIFGFSLSFIGEKAKPMARVIDALADAMIKMTEIVMKYAPIGVFALIAYTVSHHGLAVLLPLVKVIITMYVAAILMIVGVYAPVAKFAGYGPKTLWQGISEPFMVAFSTCSSAAAMASAMESTQKMGAKKLVSSFVIPLGNTINMDGTAVYMGVCAIFAAEIYGIPMPFDKQMTVILISVLASIGCMAVPGAGLIMISMVFTQVGIPLEAVALIAGIDRILDMARTSVNVTGDCVGALLISKLEPKDEDEVPAAA